MSTMGLLMTCRVQRCTAGVELDALLPDAQQGGVIDALCPGAYLDTGMTKQLGGLEQFGAVQVFWRNGRDRLLICTALMATS